MTMLASFKLEPVMIMNKQTKLIATHGFNKYQLRYKMMNSFHIPDTYISGLAKYLMVHMSGSEFKRRLFDGTIAGTPDIENTYAIIYHNCKPFEVKCAQEIRISYRRAKPEFELESYALVEIVHM